MGIFSRIKHHEEKRERRQAEGRAQERFQICEYDGERIESRVMISEGDLFMARRHAEMNCCDGFPLSRSLNESTLIEDSTEHCVRELFKTARQFVNVTVDKECHWPDIVITAEMMVGKKRG